MITCYTVKPKCPKFALNPKMWINVGEYHKYIYHKRHLKCPKEACKTTTILHSKCQKWC